MSETKMSEIIKTSLEGVKNFTDVESAIGEPIITSSGVTIIPVSKVSFGFATGGLDFGQKRLVSSQNFGGGGGTGLTVTPAGFIVISKDGDVDFINVGMKIKADPIDQIADLVERTPDILAKIKKLFSKESSDEE